MVIISVSTVDTEVSVISVHSGRRERYMAQFVRSVFGLTVFTLDTGSVHSGQRVFFFIWRPAHEVLGRQTVTYGIFGKGVFAGQCSFHVEGAVPHNAYEALGL
jgi:hypothetical protein